MSWIGSRPFIGAYVCPRGVFAVEFKRARGGYRIARSFDAAGTISSFGEASNRLVDALRAAGIHRADVAVAVRGFGVVHHVLQLPPADPEVLTPVIEREMRRLEPQLGDSIVGWITLPAMREVEPEAPAEYQRSLLAVGAPSALVFAFEEKLRATSYRLVHMTGLTVGMQRLLEEFEPERDAAGIITPLPDGAFLGFALDGALRIVVEPHLPQDAEHELSALAEEAHLGEILVRQQFRGAHITHFGIAGTKLSLRDAEEVLSERLGMPVRRYDIRELSPAGYAALGAVLDARSAAPLSLGGATRSEAVRARAETSVDKASYAAIALVLALAGLTVVQAVRSRDAAIALREVRARVARDSVALAPIRVVATQRRATHAAAEAMRLSASDRVELQQALAAIAYAVRTPVRIDTLHLKRGPEGWSALLTGQVRSETSARAVQWLHDLYREIPRRLPVDSVRLDQLTYDETPEAATDNASVRFQLSFDVVPRRKD